MKARKILSLTMVFGIIFGQPPLSNAVAQLNSKEKQKALTIAHYAPNEFRIEQARMKIKVSSLLEDRKYDELEKIARDLEQNQRVDSI